MINNIIVLIALGLITLWSINRPNERGWVLFLSLPGAFFVALSIAMKILGGV